MKTKTAVVASVLAVAAVWVAGSYRNTNHRPSDLRDAVSDAPVLDTLKTGAQSPLSQAPIPGTPEVKARAAGEKRQAKAARLDGNWLNGRQQAALLAEIDAVCGDTWCEGQFNYRFTSFECEKGLCSLELFMWDYYGEPQSIYNDASGSAGRLPAERITCDMKGFQKYGDLMESTAQGRPALSEKLYVDISDCIAKAEASSGVPLADR